MESLVPDQRFISLSCQNHGTHVWDITRGGLLAELPTVSAVEGNYFSALPALTAGDRAAIARGNTVEVYALPSGQLLHTIVHPAAVNAVAFAPAGHDLVSGAVNGSLLLTRGESDPIALPMSSAEMRMRIILIRNYAGAVPFLEQALHLRPEYPEARTNLAEAVRLCGLTVTSECESLTSDDALGGDG